MTTTLPTVRRSYAFLLDRLLPVHLLGPTRFKDLESALVLDDRDRLYRATLAALCDLSSSGHFEELPAIRTGYRLFQRRGTADRVHLKEPIDRAQQTSRPTRVTTSTVPNAETDTQAGVVQTGRIVSQTGASDPKRSDPNAKPTADVDERARILESDVLPEPVLPGADSQEPQVRANPASMSTWGELEPLLDLTGIETQLEPLGDRLRRLLARLEQSLPGVETRLLCLEQDGSERLGNGAIEILDPQALEEMPHYREALRSGRAQFATSAPEGSDPSSGTIAAAVPIQVSGESWGLLHMAWPQGSTASIPELTQALLPVTRLITLAIQNQTALEKLVFVDPLTGAYNRAFYERQVILEMERANRTNRKLALLVMDIDDFKRINDQYGHRAGDDVLALLSREVLGRMRKIDLMFRYGGEEFVLLLPGADLDEAKRTAERLRLVVGEHRFRPEGVETPIRVTVSVGGAVYPDQSRTKGGLFNAADAALYRAKGAGKNSIAF